MFFVFLFTTAAFAVFMYSHAWRHRYVTQIRLDIQQMGGRVISIQRTLRERKNLRGKTHPEMALQRVAWIVVYKDVTGRVHQTQCLVMGDRLHWDPPLI